MKYLLLLLLPFLYTTEGKRELTFINKLKQYEGYVGKYKKIKRPINSKSDYGSYYDSGGHLTTGYGHLVLKSDKINYPNYDMNNLTKEQADVVLIHDIIKHDKLLDKHLKLAGINKEELNLITLDALRNITFQIGIPDTLKRIGKKEITWKQAAKEMVKWKWYRQSGQRAKDIIKAISIGDIKRGKLNE